MANYNAYFYEDLKHGDLIRIGKHLFVYDDCIDFYTDYSRMDDNGFLSTIASAVSLVDEDEGCYLTVYLFDDGRVCDITTSSDDVEYQVPDNYRLLIYANRT